MGLPERVLRRFIAAQAKHYRVDRRLLKVLNDKDAQMDSARFQGGYEKYDIKIVPLSKVNVPKVWNPPRFEKARAHMEAGQPLDPVRVVVKGGKYDIEDGIHRTNASIALGYTHLPVLVATWVETPELLEREEAEKPELPLGTWVKLHKPFEGREYGWVVQHLGTRPRREIQRHWYELDLVKPGDALPDSGDFGDHDFDVVTPPAWAVALKDL